MSQLPLLLVRKGLDTKANALTLAVFAMTC